MAFKKWDFFTPGKSLLSLDTSLVLRIKRIEFPNTSILEFSNSLSVPQ